MGHHKTNDFLRLLCSNVGLLRWRSLVYFITLMAACFFLPTMVINAQYSMSEKALMIVKTAEKYHYNPRPIDDNFSALVFEEFIGQLDPDGTIFTKDEIDQLASYKYKLDEEILNNKYDFVSEVTILYSKKLLFIDSLVNSFTIQELDLLREDTLFFSKDEIYLNYEQLIKKWKGLIKIQVLSSYLSGFTAEQDPQQPHPEIMSGIIERIVKRESCAITSITNYPGGVKELVGSKFLKAISFAFDPHTAYFTLVEEQQFLSSISTEVYSFGLEIYRNDFGEIEIYGIVPGSPAWNSNACNEGDVILEISTLEEASYDLNCLSMAEVINFMYSDEIEEACFTLRKKNKIEVLVTLHKDQINVEENVIKSFILEGDHKVGYIYLPSFYAQMDGTPYSPNGCANDVAKELIKLKKEGIQGLIIDIRNNGGGSMLEAIQMAGIFINYGTLCILHVRGDDPVTIKDINRGTIYDDPLLILQNKFSASASELLAATLQDHNRAIIVGSPSFGKSTGQEILPIDSYQNQFSANSNTEGYLKLTRSTFYRVSGKSHQKEGVIPDIILPDIFDHIELGEGTFNSALDPSFIQKKTYYYPLPPLPIEDLRTGSEQRVKNDSIFHSINEMGTYLSEVSDQYSIPLAYDSFKEFYFSEPFFQVDLELFKSDEELFLVNNPSYISGMSDLKEVDKEINEDIMVTISSDVYINESYKIINGLINLTK